MRKDGFTVCANNYINCLRQEGRYATAHVYENALRSFTIFCGTECVSFSLITRENLKRYSSYLMSCRLKLNTISTYMRMLRCIYNKGVDTHQAPYIHRLFRDVFTGVDTRQKKAIPINELHTLLYKDPQSEKLRRTQAIANLLFLFCGMPFDHWRRKDVAHAISECVGNKKLINFCECYECNHLFGEIAENHLGKFIMPYRIINEVYGKGAYKNVVKDMPVEKNLSYGTYRFEQKKNDSIFPSEICVGYGR